MKHVHLHASITSSRIAYHDSDLVLRLTLFLCDLLLGESFGKNRRLVIRLAISFGLLSFGISFRIVLSAVMFLSTDFLH